MHSTRSHRICLKCFTQNQQNSGINVTWIPSKSHPQEYKEREGGRDGERGEGKGWKEGKLRKERKGKEKEGKGERERRKKRVKKNSILPTKIKNNSSINLDSLILNVSFYGRDQRL